VALALTVADGAVAARARVGAGEARLWAVLIVMVAYWANIVRLATDIAAPSFAAAIGGIVDNGAFDVFACGLVLVHVAAHTDRRPAARREILWTVLLGLIVLPPARLAAAAGLGVLGWRLAADRDAPRPLRPLRFVLFALALETIWMSPFLSPLHVLVGGLDARATAALLRALGQTAARHANVVENASTEFSIVIWPYCASSFPLADVVLAFVVIVLYRGRALRAWRLPWLGASLVASVLLTELRLVLLARDEASYDWWHFGPGVAVYTLAALALSVVFPILATSGAGVAEAGTIRRTAA
jgi:hypothetical protein